MTGALATSVTIDDSTFTDAIQDSFIVGRGIDLTLVPSSIIEVAEDIGIFGNIEGQGAIALRAHDDMIIAGNLTTSAGMIEITADGDITISGNIRGSATGLTITSGGSITIDGTIALVGPTTAGTEGGPLSVSAAANILITGIIQGGDGAGGDPKSILGTAIGDPGANGGPVTIRAGNILTLDQGQIIGGSGGQGGTAVGKTATGGNGGDSGNMQVSAAHIMVDGGIFISGAGGPGGNAIALPNNDASASGGNGGAATAPLLTAAGRSISLQTGAWLLDFSETALQLTNYSLGHVAHGQGSGGADPTDPSGILPDSLLVWCITNSWTFAEAYLEATRD